MYRKLIGIRNELGYKQSDIAKEIGISERAYNFKELGKTDFSITQGKKIAKLFNRSLDEIFDTTSEPIKNKEE